MKLVKRIIDYFWLFKEYNQVIGFLESLNFIIDDILKRNGLRTIEAKGIKLVLRSNSPDLKVAIRTLFLSEYEEIDLKSASFIVDAGAYIGTSAIFFSKKYPKAKVIAIEPEEGNFKLLLKNVKPYKSIIPIKSALWSSSERKLIFDRNTGYWGYTISDTFNEIKSTDQYINCTTISDIMSQYDSSNIDILKMDIEGSEKTVLENSTQWIDKVNVLSIELHDRIIEGCSRSFYLATKNFSRFEKNGEKVTAYRK